jgi:hypothetical protein
MDIRKAVLKMYEYAQSPLYNPMINPYFPQQQQPQHPKTEVVKVNGENGARAFPMGPNSSALLLDVSGVIVWAVTTDGAGYKTVSPFDISPHKEAPAPDFDSLDARITRLEEMIGNAATGNPATAQRREQPAAARTDQESDYNAAQHAKPAGSYATPDAAASTGNGAGAGLYQAARQRSESGF